MITTNQHSSSSERFGLCHCRMKSLMDSLPSIRAFVHTGTEMKSLREALPVCRIIMEVFLSPRESPIIHAFLFETFSSPFSMASSKSSSLLRAMNAAAGNPEISIKMAIAKFIANFYAQSLAKVRSVHMGGMKRRWRT